MPLSGCDSGVSLPDGPIEVTGRVVLAPDGQPLPDLGVELLKVPPSFGATVTLAATRTDADGRFSLRHVVPPGAGTGGAYQVQVNAPYDNRYTVGRERVPDPPVELDLGTFEIRLNEGP